MTAWRTSFMRRLRRRLSLRWHMTGIILLAGLGALLASKLLLLAGLEHMGYRYGAVVLIAYALFFILIHLWIKFVASEPAPQPAPTTRMVPDADGVAMAEGLPDMVDGSLAMADLGSGAGGGGDVDLDVGGGGGGGGGGSLSLDIGDGEGAIIAIAVAIVAIVVFGAAIYVIYQAPLILSEATFGAVLAGSLGHAAGKANREGWAVSVLRATWIPALLVFGVAAGLGFLLRALCPVSVKLGQALQMCVFN